MLSGARKRLNAPISRSLHNFDQLITSTILRLRSTDVELLPSDEYDDDLAEVGVLIQKTEDLSLPSELFPELQCQVEIVANIAVVFIPVITSCGSKVGLLIASYTDAKKVLYSPYVTNVDTFIYIDSIEIENGYLVLRRDDDLMEVAMQHDEICTNNGELEKDLVHIEGTDIHSSSYPLQFNWGCDHLGNNVSFCRVLEPYTEDIQETNSDICVTMSTPASRVCSADMEITNMTGIFRENAPFLANSLPNAAFESLWLIREHMLGIVFPCL